jgi:hypothetical protein
VNSSDDLGVTSTRMYTFVLTVEVEEDHVGYDDPEWLADAAWGALSNDYGLRCTYGPTVLVGEDDQET